MKLLTKAATIFDRTLQVFALLAGIMVTSLMLIVCADVFLRYFFNAPIKWTIDVTEVCLLYITFLVAAWVLRNEGHTKMDLVITRLNPDTQAVINMITSIIGAFIWLLITWYGARVTYSHLRAGTILYSTMEFPLAPIEIIIPIGSLLFFIQFLRTSYGYFRTWRALRGKEQMLDMSHKSEL